MVQKETNLNLSDKCGVWSVRVFHLYGGFFTKFCYPGGFLKVAVKKVRPDNIIPKKTKSKAILILAKKESIKIDGSYIKFYTNNILLLKKRLTSRGKIIVGPANNNIKRKKLLTSFTATI